MSKSLILAVQIIGDARSLVKATETTSSALDKMSGGAAVAGTAAGAALAAGFAGAVSVEAGLDKVQGQLGLTEAEAARVGTVSAELFANGWGTGAEQINEALSSVIGNVEGMRSATDAELAAVSQQVLTVANTFDQDLGGVTTAVGQMMRTGMAKDATEALDLITTGLQANTRAGEDLTDTLTEYPALFERLGIDGQTAMGLISQGLDAGARSTDLVADALKEFQIRATDGSKASAEGFAALGLSAEQMTAQIAGGGEGASAGLDTVLDRLRAMTDPVEQNAAAVALFGTQAEDLGGALYALDPSGAVAALGQVEGSATKLGDTMSGNAQSRITEFTRSIQTSFQDVAAAAIPVVEPVLGLLRQFAPILGPIAVVIAAVSGAILVANGAMKVWAAVQAIQTAAQWANNAAWLASPITWIILAIIAAIAILIGVIMLIVQNWDKIKAAGVAAWEAIVAWVQTAIAWVGDRVQEVIDGAISVWQGFQAAVSAVWEAIVGWIRSAVDWVSTRIKAAITVARLVFLGLKIAAAAVWQNIIDWVRRAIEWLGEKISAPIKAAKKMFEDLKNGAINVFKSIIQWIKDTLKWLGDLASNAIPDWAKELLGMGGKTVTISGTIAPMEAPEYVGSIRYASAAGSRPSGPATVTDNRTYNVSFPNYTGDRRELVAWLRTALQTEQNKIDGILRA